MGWSVPSLLIFCGSLVRRGGGGRGLPLQLSSVPVGLTSTASAFLYTVLLNSHGTVGTVSHLTKIQIEARGGELLVQGGLGRVATEGQD